MRKPAVILIALLLMTAGTGLYYAFVHTPEVPVDRPEEVADDMPEEFERATAFYESRPYFQRPHPYTPIPAGLPDIDAETCGNCHQAIYEEWKISTHRRAYFDDAQFQAELKKSRGHGLNEDNGDVGWLCVNCHTPVMNQLEKLVVGLENDEIQRPIYVENPIYEESFEEDAITCATCHVRDGIVYGPFGDTDAPHPTAKGEFLVTEEVCVRCHQAEAHWPSRNLACFFSTGEEWAQSEYAAEGRICQDCHMPEIERKLADAYDRPPRTTRRHWFGGSLIPKKPEFADELRPLRKVFGSGVDISLIETPEDVPSTVTPETQKGSSEACSPDGPCSRFAIRITNANAGHDFPTGDPERHADIEAVARTDDGRDIATASVRIGSRYQWWPEIKLLSNNRIPPGETMLLPLEVPARPPFEVRIVADKYRMYRDAFEHHDLEGRYVRGRQFHESLWNVTPEGSVELRWVEDDFGRRETLAH